MRNERRFKSRRDCSGESGDRQTNQTHAADQLLSSRLSVRRTIGFPFDEGQAADRYHHPSILGSPILKRTSERRRGGMGEVCPTATAKMKRDRAGARPARGTGSPESTNYWPTTTGGAAVELEQHGGAEEMAGRAAYEEEPPQQRLCVQPTRGKMATATSMANSKRVRNMGTPRGGKSRHGW